MEKKRSGGTYYGLRPCHGQPMLFLLVGSALEPPLIVLVDLCVDVVAPALCHMDG